MATGTDDTKATRRLLGIVLTMDADGLVTGAELGAQSLEKLEKQATATAGGFDRSMRLMMGVAAGLGSALALAFGIQGAGGAMVLGMTANIDAAKRFQVELTKLQFVTQASEDQMRELHDLAIQTGLDTMFDPEESVQAMVMLGQFGLALKDVKGTLASTLDFVGASGGEIDLGAGTQVTGNLMTKFQLKAEDLGGALDKLAMSAIASNAGFQDFLPYLNSLGASVTKTGASVEDIFAIGGALRNSGQLAAQSGQSFNGFIRTMTGLQVSMDRMKARGGKGGFAIKEDLEALKSLGITAKDIDLTKPVELLAKMATGLNNIEGKDASETQRKRAKVMQVLLGDQSSAVLAAAASLKVLDESTGVMLKGGDALVYMRDKIAGAEGVTKKASDTMLKTLEQQEKQLEGSIKTMQILAGEHLMPMWTELRIVATTALNSVLTLMMRFPNLTKNVLLGVLALGVFLSVLGSVSIAAITLAGSLIGATIAAVDLFGWLTAVGIMQAAVLWPLTLVAAALLTVFSALAILLSGAALATLMAWQFNLGSFRDMILGWVTALSLAGETLGEFWDDYKAPKDLVDSLRDASPRLLDLVTGLLGLKYRLGELLAGMQNSKAWLVFAFGAELVGAAILTVLDLGFEFLTWLARLMGYSGKGAEWRAFGDALMWVVLGVTLLAGAAAALVMTLVAVSAAIVGVTLLVPGLIASIALSFALLVFYVVVKVVQLLTWLHSRGPAWAAAGKAWIVAMWNSFQVGWTQFKGWLSAEASQLSGAIGQAMFSSILPPPLRALLPNTGAGPSGAPAPSPSKGLFLQPTAPAGGLQRAAPAPSTTYSLGGFTVNIDGAGDKADEITKKVLAALQQQFDDATAGAF